MAEATTGAAFTLTVNVSDTVPPLPSSAVTVMAAVPLLLAETVRLDWSAATDTVAAASSSDAAVTVRLSLSASANTPDREIVCVPLSLTMVASAIALATVGALLGGFGCGSGCEAASISRSAAVTSTQRVQPLSANSWASSAVMGSSVASATVSPKANSVRSQRSVWSLLWAQHGSSRHSLILAMSAAYFPPTETSKESLTALPSLSWAVTVIVAAPSATPATVSLDWSVATVTVTLASSEDAAVMVRLSPSASLNTPDRDTSCVASTSRPLTSARAEATTGAAFTVTVKLSSTVPPLPSSAVTVMVAVPLLLAVTVSVE